jgi:excisionase family DNA binding protein
MKVKLMTVKQFCMATGLSPTTVYRKAQKGIIPTVRIGGSVRIPVWYLHQLTEEPGKLPGFLTRGEGSQFRLSDTNHAATLIEVVNDRSRSKADPQTPTTKSVSVLPQDYDSTTGQPVGVDSLTNREIAVK